MVIYGSYTFKFSVSKDMKKMPLTLEKKRFASRKVGNHL